MFFYFSFENDDVMESFFGLLILGIIIFLIFMIIIVCVLVIVICKKNYIVCFGKFKLNGNFIYYNNWIVFLEKKFYWLENIIL